MRPLEPIPVEAARAIAERYGFDQVVIIARRVGDAPDPHGEHVTTFGTMPEHAAVAARTGDFLKYRVMSWRDQPVTPAAPDDVVLVAAPLSEQSARELNLGVHSVLIFAPKDVIAREPARPAHLPGGAA